MQVTKEFVEEEEKAFEEEFGMRCFEGNYDDLAKTLTEEGFYLVDNELFFDGLFCGYNSDRVAEILEGGRK